MKKILLFFLLLAAPYGFAQNPANTLPAVVVTGTADKLPATSASEIPLPESQTTVVRETENLSARVPNLFVASSSLHSFGDVFTLRGIGNTVFFSSPGVGLYIDGVPAGDAFTFFAPMYDIDRVDIFRSPQGFRFGLNSEGGVIDIATRRASAEAWHGEASASYSSYDTQEYRLSLGGPLIQDKLTLALSGFWGLSDGFIHNAFLGGHRDTRDTLAGRAVLTWTPSPDWEISAGIEMARVNDGQQRLVSLASPDPLEVRSNTPGSLRLREHREWLDIGKKFDTWEVRSITAHSQWEIDPAVVDLDFSPATPTLAGIFPGIVPVAPGATSEIRRHQESWSEEIIFQSLPPAPKSAPEGKGSVDGKSESKTVLEREDGFRWKIGLFFQSKHTDGDDLRSFSFPFVTAPPPFFTPITIYTPLAQRTLYTLRDENWAGYANGGYTFGNLDMDAGVRVDYSRKTLDRTKADGMGGSIHISGETQEWTAAPSMGATYHINDNIDLFARTSYGFKPSGFSAYTDNPDLAHYKQETVWASEVGVRAKALDGRLRGSLVGYYDWIRNYQVERSFSFTDYLVANAGRAESLGVEAELAFEIAHGFFFSGNIGYNQTQLLDYRDPLTGANLSHNEAPYVPNFTALVALDYAHECGFRAHVEYVATGDTDFTDTNAARYKQSAFGLLNARIGFERDHYGVYLFGRNLTDKRYFTLKESDIDAGVVGEPRILGVMALVKF